MSKRGENIYKRKDGRWEGRLKNESKKYSYVYGKTYSEVKEKMKELIKNNHDNQTDEVNMNRKASDLLDEWLNDSYIRVKSSTYENYYYCVQNYIRPYFENSKTKSFTKEEICSFIKTINNNSSLSDSYRKKILTIFKVAIRAILKNSDNAKSVLDLLIVPYSQQKTIQVFSIQEQKTIEKALIKCNNFKSISILLCFYTGLRLGELCALKWKHINLETKTVFVLGTLTRTKNFTSHDSRTSLTVGSPKNRSSIRNIPIPDFIIEILKTYVHSVRNQEHFLLSNANMPLDPRSLQKYYKNILHLAGVEYRKFHTVRHTFATRTLELGVDVKTLSELLGHSSVTNTLNIYTHSLLEQKRSAIGKLNSLHTTQMMS